jgi:HD-GYP domain-containing protein (c-di-GMP phosphodiesterase class II)
MTQDRVYRKAITHEAALEEIKKNAGTQFDPQIAMLFIEVVSDEYIRKAAKP